MCGNFLVINNKFSTGKKWEEQTQKIAGVVYGNNTFSYKVIPSVSGQNYLLNTEKLMGHMY